MHNCLFLCPTQSTFGRNWLFVYICIDCIWLPAPELQITCPLSPFLIHFPENSCAMLLVFSTNLSFLHAKYSFIHPFYFLWIPPFSHSPQSHSPLELHSAYLPYFLSGSHSILSFHLLYSPPHLLVLSLLLSASYTILPHHLLGANICSCSMSFTFQFSGPCPEVPLLSNL